jgi:hypothetical protein
MVAAKRCRVYTGLSQIGYTVIFETRQNRKRGRLETEELIRRG